MPIKPIDLQSLFGQLDRIGREQAASKEGAALQGAARADALQKRAEEKARSVQRPADSDDAGSRGVDPDGKGPGSDVAGTGQGDERDTAPARDEGADEAADEEVIRDPGLGTKIDLSG